MLAPLPAEIVSAPYDPEISSAFFVPVIVKAVEIVLSFASFQINVPVDVAITEASTVNVAGTGVTPVVTAVKVTVVTPAPSLVRTNFSTSVTVAKSKVEVVLAELTTENWSVPPLPSNLSPVSSEVSAVVPVITHTSSPEPPRSVSA